MRSLVSYWYPVEKHVCLSASVVLLCFFTRLKRQRERETPGELDKGHAKPHYHRGRPMSCKKSLVVLGKEGKWVMLLGSQRHDGKRLVPGSTDYRRLEWERRSRKPSNSLASRFTLFKKL